MKKYTRTYNKSKTNSKPKKSSGTKKNSKSKNNKTLSTIKGYAVLIVLLLIPLIFSYLYFNGRYVIEIPKGCGWYATREWDLKYYDCAVGSNQYKVDRLWHKEGTEDGQGFQKLYGRYLIACTRTFGEVGDKIDFVMSDGTVLKCIIYDNKSQEKTFYDQNPADKWGHHHGAVVMEFVGTAALENNPYKNLGLQKEHTVKAIRYGNILD